MSTKTIVKILVVCLAVIIMVVGFMVAAGNTAPTPSYYSADNYSRDIRWKCVKATSFKRGIATYNDIPASKECFSQVVAEHRNQRLVESQIRLNNEAADYLNKNHRGHRRVRR